MSCPLIGRIAITKAVGGLFEHRAIRVRDYRSHDVILLNPEVSPLERMAAILEEVMPWEGDRLVWDVECTCTRMLYAVSA